VENLKIAFLSAISMIVCGFGGAYLLSTYRPYSDLEDFALLVGAIGIVVLLVSVIIFAARKKVLLWLLLAADLLVYLSLIPLMTEPRVDAGGLIFYGLLFLVFVAISTLVCIIGFTVRYVRERSALYLIGVLAGIAIVVSYIILAVTQTNNT